MKNVKTPLIIGALHLPYYGTQDPGRSLAEVEDYVLGNASIFYENGINKLILQDENIVPERAEPETIAVMAAISRLVRRELPKLHIGIIVQAHDPKASIAIAHASGAEFVRQKVFAGVMLKAEGLRTGVGPDMVRYRTALGAKVRILADIHYREGTPVCDVPITDTAGWADRMGADGLILTGKDYAQTKRYFEKVNAMELGKPLIVGGSVNTENIRDILSFADGAVVSTSLMRAHTAPGDRLHWDPEKIRRFCDEVDACR